MEATSEQPRGPTQTPAQPRALDGESPAPDDTTGGGSPAAAIPQSASTWSVLRHRHYRNIWLAAFGSSLGGWMEIVGVQWSMAKATVAESWTSRNLPEAPVMMAYLAVAQMGPLLLLALPGGVAADRLNRRRLLLTTQTARMLVAIALCVLAYRGVINPWVLMVLGFLDGVALAFNIPAWQVLIPRLVPREDLTRAITLNGLQFNLARALGPALGGLLMAQFGVGMLFLINALSYAGVIWAVWITPDASEEARAPRASIWQSTIEGCIYVWRHKGARFLILAIVLFSMLGTPLLRLMPLIVKGVYRMGEDIYGVLLGVMGGGAVLGALSIRYIPWWYPKHHFVPLSMTVGSVFLALYGLMTNVFLAAAAVFFTGIFWMWSFNSAFAALQMLVEDRIRGRVLAICNMLSFGAMPLGAYAAGLIAQQIDGDAPNAGHGSRIALVVLAALLFVISLAMLIWRTPEADGLKPGDKGYDRRPGLFSGITASAHRPR